MRVGVSTIAGALTTLCCVKHAPHFTAPTVVYVTVKVDVLIHKTITVIVFIITLIFWSRKLDGCVTNHLIQKTSVDAYANTLTSTNATELP